MKSGLHFLKYCFSHLLAGRIHLLFRFYCLALPMEFKTYNEVIAAAFIGLGAFRTPVDTIGRATLRFANLQFKWLCAPPNGSFPLSAVGLIY